MASSPLHPGRPLVSAVALLLASCSGAPSERAPRNDRAEASRLLRQGLDFLAAGDTEAARGALEKVVASEPSNGEAWLALAEASERFADARVASGADPGASFKDAARGFAEACRLLPKDPRPRLGLAREGLRGSDWEEAAERAAEARALAESIGSRVERFGANRILAEARIRFLASLPSADSDPATRDALARRATLALDACAALEPARPEPFLLGAELDSLLGDEARARERLRRGVEACPENEVLHQRLQRTYLARTPPETETLLAAYEELAAARPESPATGWFLAYARFLSADERRRAHAWGEAIAGYEGAAAAYEEAGGRNPAFLDSCSHYEALALGSRGWCRHGEGDLQAAARLFLEAIERRPAILQAPDALGMTAKGGIDAVAAAWTDAGELERARDLFEKGTALVPQQSDWQNNLGFLCRQTGTAAEMAREPEKAKALYERSFAAYEKALRVMPEDPRLLNDCALILLYHLDRDLDRAEAMFRQAIELGEHALADSSVAAEKREALLEAVGDACENLGVLHHDKKKDLAGAKAFFERSLEYAPRPRPRVSWYLSKIEEASGRAVPPPAGAPR